MPDGLREAVFGTADRLGVNWTLRRMFRDDIAVLMYHGLLPDEARIDAWTMVGTGEFRRQMEYVKTHCDVVSARDLLSAGSAQALVARRHGKPRVMITFDDGYRSNYTCALPVLESLEIPAIIFVATGFIDNGNEFWYDKVILALQRCRPRELDLRADGLGVYTFPEGPPSRRWDAIQQVLTALKTLDIDRRERLATRIRADLAVPAGDEQLFAALTSADIAALHRGGLVTIASHTDRHEILTQTRPEDAENTVAVSLRKLRDITGEDCRLFSYPNGDFDESHVAMLKRQGIDYAFTTRKAFWDQRADARAIPRIGIGGYDSPARFAALLSGLAV